MAHVTPSQQHSAPRRRSRSAAHWRRPVDVVLPHSHQPVFRRRRSSLPPCSGSWRLCRRTSNVCWPRTSLRGSTHKGKRPPSHKSRRMVGVTAAMLSSLPSAMVPGVSHAASPASAPAANHGCRWLPWTNNHDETVHSYVHALPCTHKGNIPKWPPNLPQRLVV